MKWFDYLRAVEALESMKVINAVERKLCTRLALYYANRRTGECWPSAVTIAEVIGHDGFTGARRVRSVYLPKLVEVGLIELEKRTAKTTKIRCVVPVPEMHGRASWERPCMRGTGVRAREARTPVHERHAVRVHERHDEPEEAISGFNSGGSERSADAALCPGDTPHYDPEFMAARKKKLDEEGW